VRRKNNWLLALVVGLVLVFSTSLCVAGPRGEKKLTVEQMAQRALDYLEIQNVMSRHEYYHTQGTNTDELKEIWVTKAPYTETATFTMNRGKMIGMKSIINNYSVFHDRASKLQLELINRVRPDIKNIPENIGVGDLLVHTLTTACIEIAGDGKTAKGMWYTPGVLASVSTTTGKPSGRWIWERYGIDFVKEDGHWKIWHLFVGTDFQFGIGDKWPKDKEVNPDGVNLVDTEKDGPPPELLAIMPKLDSEAEFYQEYSSTKVERNVPRPPEPYYTFSETFSY